ncbi:unnamed protein product [Macrosiphum euphorbiae]|uniref:Uncharacterized protein n=1 Tax=Macrosiphum euphorbiae TaxID=13131 RepID=A0AAV0XY58_9HEMI|nr:unnamed protein product [Macrosiphum euphorbiae]
MFMNTLGISSRVIFTTTQKMCDVILEVDKRGKHGKHGLAISLEVKDNIRSHITSFPAIESHYCRSATSKKFIDGSLNISLMYKLYVEYCINQNLVMAKNISMKQFLMKNSIFLFIPPKKTFACAVNHIKTKVVMTS